MVNEVILTDKDGQQILPITRHTQVYVGNERLSAYLDNNFSLLSTAVQSLQSQKADKTFVDSSITNAINALDVTDSAQTNKFVTAVSEADGKISVSRAQPKIGDVNGLQSALDGKLAKTGLEYTSGENLVYQQFRVGSANTSVTDNGKSITISPENRDTYFYIKFADTISAGEILSVSFDVEYEGEDDGSWKWIFGVLDQNSEIVCILTGSGHYTAYGVSPKSVQIDSTGIFDDATRNRLPINSFKIKNLKVERGSVATGFCLCPAEQRAAKLTTPRTIQTNLGSTTAASFDGSANVTPGITGTLPVANGGTGATTAANARTNLDVYSKSEVSSTYATKVTYEYNKELSLGSNGLVCLGKFPCYDTNVTIDLDSTTGTQYHGTIILATQNINTTGGGTHSIMVFGDASNRVTPAIKYSYNSGSNVISIYAALPGWSKNLAHVRAVNLRSAPTDVLTSISAIPADATKTATNAILTAISGKQDNISDLDTIRSGATLGATAVQPAAISDMETKTHASGTYATQTALNGKANLTGATFTGKVNANAGLSSKGSGDAVIDFGGAASTVDYAIIHVSGGSNNTRPLVLQDGASGEVGSGNVAIGHIIAPSEKLEVQGNVKATTFIGNLTGKASTAGIADNASGYTAGGSIAIALDGKQDKIDSSHKLAYSLISGTPTIGNGTIYFTLGTGPSRTDFQMFTLNQTGSKVIGLYRGSHIQIEHTAESGSLNPEGFTISTDIVDADATHKGLVTTVAQTIAGDKTFTGNVTSDKQIVGKQGVAAEGISDLSIPQVHSEVQDYKDLIHKTDTASGSTYPFALDTDYKRQYLVLALTQVQTAVTFDTSAPCAEQYILLDNDDDTAKTVSVVSSLANGLVVGDTAIEVAAYESVEVSIITTAADASEYDSSYTGKLCVVTSHAIKWD